MILLDDYSLAAASPEPRRKSSLTHKTTKNRVWKNFGTPSGRHVQTSSQVVETASGCITYSYNIASGRAVWPNRDPIGESGGINLYGFIQNDGINDADDSGLSSLKEKLKLALESLKNADWAGVELMTHYLTGSGKDFDRIDDARWASYVKKDSVLRLKVRAEVLRLAQESCPKSVGAHPVAPFAIHVDFSPGEGFNGYNLLGGSNRNVGDFEIKGETNVLSTGGGCCEVVLKLRYTFNDITDPNFRYETDAWKDKVAGIISAGQRAKFKTKISFESSSSYQKFGSGNALELFWPFE